MVAVAGADFDGDGVWDAVVRGYDNIETVLLGGNGDGTFRPPILIDADSPGQPRHAAAAAPGTWSSRRSVLRRRVPS